MPMSPVEPLSKEMEEPWTVDLGSQGHGYTRMCVQAQGEPWAAIWAHDQELRWLG